MLRPRETFSLVSERLILRDWKPSDWKAAQEYAGDPEVCKYMIWGPNSETETKNFLTIAIELASARPRTGYELAIVLKESEKIIGGCGMRVEVNESHSHAMIGYVLNRAYWAKGLATEAANRLLKFGFEQMKLHRIYADCDAENIGSQRVLEKCGMRKEGHFREDMMIKGRWCDSFLYAILESEWRANGEAADSR